MASVSMDNRDELLSRLRERYRKMTNCLGAEHVDRVISFLNELAELDGEAIFRLVETRVQCNSKMADHPTVQVAEDEDGNPVVGLLGVVNGIFGTRSNKGGYIAAVIDDDGKFVKFVRTGSE